MPYLNVKDRVLEAKIVYYGAGLCGKTTNLEQIKEKAKGGRTGDMMSLNTDGDRTLFFDWIPFDIGKVNGCDVRVQLYTVPGQTKYAETRRRVLAGADGVVMVLDSQAGALDRNKQSVQDLFEHLKANKLDPAKTPIVVQLNKRDLPTAMEPAALLEAVGLADRPHHEAVAATGQGVFETLQLTIGEVLKAMRDSARTPGAIKSGEKSNMDGHTLRAALERDESVPPPPAPSTNGASTNGAAANGTNGTHSNGTGTNGRPSRLPPSEVKVPAAARPARPQAMMSAGAGGAMATVTSTRSSSGAGARPRAAGDASSSGSAQRTRLNEIIAGHRTLARRIDALEASISTRVERSVADVVRLLKEDRSEADVAAQVDEVLARRLEEELAPVREGLAAVARSEAIDVLTARFASLDGLADAIGAQVEARLSGVADPIASMRELLEGANDREEQLAQRVRELSVRLAAMEARLEEDGEAAREGIEALAARQKEMQGQVTEAAAAAKAASSAAESTAGLAKRYGADVEKLGGVVSKGFEGVSRELEERQRTLWSQVEQVAGQIIQQVSGSVEEGNGHTLRALSKLSEAIGRLADLVDGMDDDAKLKSAIDKAMQPLQQTVRAVPQIAERVAELTPMRTELATQGEGISAGVTTILDRVRGLEASLADIHEKGKKSWWRS